MTQLIELGRDPDGKISSLPRIDKGSERGYRQREVDGTWHYVSGYDCCFRYGERSVHNEWAKRLTTIGFRVGTCVDDGVVSFYVFEKATT